MSRETEGAMWSGAENEDQLQFRVDGLAHTYFLAATISFLWQEWPKNLLFFRHDRHPDANVSQVGQNA
jgi:hypothetical protein